MVTVNISTIAQSKRTTETVCSAFLNIHLEFDKSGPYRYSNIPSFPAYGIYILKLIRYVGASTNYSDFLELHKYLRNRLLNQVYEEMRLKRILTIFVFRYQFLVEKYSVSSTTMIVFCKMFFVLM